MPKVTIEYLRHVIDEINFLISISKGKNEAEYSRDEVTKRASVRSLEIIGEAVKSLPNDYRDTHPEIDWRSWAGLRDRLIHQYFGVDYEIVWDIMVNEMPELKEQIEKLIKE